MGASENWRYRSTRVLVLGASGFIGRWVARELSALGADLDVAVRDRRSATSLLDRYGIRARVVGVQATDPGQVRRLIAECRPQVTFNLIGYGVRREERDAGLARLLNAELPDWLGDAMERVPESGWPGRRLIHVGSALEYGTLDGDLDEAAAPRPTTDYGVTKLAGTLSVQRRAADRRLDAATARLFTVYGPGEPTGRLLPALIETAASRVPLDLTSGAQRRDFTYIEDVVEGLLRLGSSATPPPAIVNLATGRLTSVRRFAEIAAGILGIEPPLLRFGALPQREEEMHHAPVSIARLVATLGWQPELDIGEGIRRAAAFLGVGRPGTR